MWRSLFRRAWLRRFKMLEALKGMLVGLLGSKKFGMLIIGMVATALISVSAHLGLDLPKEEAQALATKLVILVGSAIGAQGIADLGKEKAKIEAEK